MHAARLDRSPRLRRVHALLADGVERSTLEIMRGANVCAVNSCVAELRANGAEIVCRQEVDRDTGLRLFLYRMPKPVPPPATPGDGRPAPNAEAGANAALGTDRNGDRET